MPVSLPDDSTTVKYEPDNPPSPRSIRKAEGLASPHPLSRFSTYPRSPFENFAMLALSVAILALGIVIVTPFWTGHAVVGVLFFVGVLVINVFSSDLLLYALRARTVRRDGTLSQDPERRHDATD